jgi:integrase
LKFTDRYVSNLKPDPAKRRIVWEDVAHGQGNLGVRIFPSGVKTFVYMYRFAGKARMQTLGNYPRMTVADAHVACANAAQEREKGIDPGAVAVDSRAMERKAPTFKELADLYLELHAKPRKKSADRDESALKRDVLPVLGPHKAEAVTRRDVIALLDGIVARGAPIQANRTLALVRKVFNFGIGRDIVQANPCYRVSAPGVEKQRDRVLTEDEIKALLGKLSTANMADESKLALRFQLLTAQRCGEVLAVRWDEIDLSGGWWTIPATKAKNKLAHRVPLSMQARAVLVLARALNPDRQTVFPSPRKDAPMVETAVARAVLRNLEHFGAGTFSPHDLRRTAASHMTGMGISRLVVSKLLNHVERGVTAVYDRHSYDAEKREALASWGTFVESLPSAAASANAA